VVIQTFYCVGGLANVLWYYTVADFQKVLIFFYLVPCICVGVSLIAFVKDTPISLLSKFTAEQALGSLQVIAKFNGKTNFNLTLSDVVHLQ
jgi:hypothetical protein